MMSEQTLARFAELCSEVSDVATDMKRWLCESSHCDRESYISPIEREEMVREIDDLQLKVELHTLRRELSKTTTLSRVDYRIMFDEIKRRLRRVAAGEHTGVSCCAEEIMSLMHIKYAEE